MSISSRWAYLTLVGVIASGLAAAQAPAEQNANPSSASSPHQRATTEQPAAESQITPESDPSAAASPHQKEVTGHVTATPSEFVKTAAQGGMNEVALGKLATAQGKDSSVRAFGERMVTDHGKANTELSAIAKRKGLEVPAALDVQHQRIVDELNAKGADFDAAYSKQMMADHDKTIALFEAATKSSDADLAAFAKKTLPTLKEHKKMAQALPRS